MKGVRARIRVPTLASFALLVAAPGTFCAEAAADTLEWALVQAYQNNPSLNAQRAALRATDENVPQALSGYRPKLSIVAQGGDNYANEIQQVPLGRVSIIPYAKKFVSRSVGATGSYTLFDGFQTANSVRQAESLVDGARETLRLTEQQVLVDAATAYMNLLRDEVMDDPRCWAHSRTM
jgi:outer membrane protein